LCVCTRSWTRGAARVGRSFSLCTPTTFDARRHGVEEKINDNDRTAVRPDNTHRCWVPRPCLPVGSRKTCYHDLRRRSCYCRFQWGELIAVRYTGRIDTHAHTGDWRTRARVASVVAARYSCCCRRTNYGRSGVTGDRITRLVGRVQSLYSHRPRYIIITTYL